MTRNLVSLHRDCRTLLDKATGQLTAEVKRDPLSSVRLGKLRALRAGVRRAVGQLQREASIFSSAADLSDVCWKRLNTLIRHLGWASRKLASILDSGEACATRTHRCRRKADLQVLTHLSSHFSFRISHVLDLEDLIAVLSVQKRGCRQQAESVTSVASTGDFSEEPTAAESMKKLAEHYSALARKCMEIYRERATDRKKEKAEAQLALADYVSRRLVPLLRDHVLRFGLHLVDDSKGRAVVTKLFREADISRARSEVELCRARLQRELSLRKASEGSPASRRSSASKRRVLLKHHSAMKRLNSSVSQPSSCSGVEA